MAIAALPLVNLNQSQLYVELLQAFVISQTIAQEAPELAQQMPNQQQFVEPAQTLVISVNLVMESL
jgi:hypothetical protein